MASFYYSSEGDDMLPTEYLLNSYQSPQHANHNNNKVHVTQPSISLPYPNLTSLSAHRDEMTFIPPPTTVDQINRQLNLTPRYGLSLSLGSQDTNSSLCSLLNSHNIHLDLNNVQYSSFDSNVQFLDFTGAFCDSKYLKAARDLLEELVNVHRVSKESGKVWNFNSACRDGSTGTDLQRDEVSHEIHNPTNIASRDLSVSERHDLQNKLTKLLSMLDEVDRRYKQYWHEMQVLVSSLDTVAGPGASLSYTSLALRTISRQFCSLRDAIKKQIHSTQKSLGEQDVNPHGELSRLRYVDQQLRQQKTLQQFGHVMRQPWRPQRGLPENAVSVLRAWLFEHFLHPYPKDSEKIVLAREAGLTRSQVANWFINARVRLWKPMIEEMYKEEFGDDTETDLKSSPEFQGSLISPLADDDNQRLQSNELRTDVISNVEIDPCRGMTYANDVFQGNNINFGFTHMQTEHNIVNVSGNSDFCDNKASQKNSANGTMGNQVNLALGWQRSENDSKPIAGGIQTTGNEYYYVDRSSEQSEQIC